MSTGLKIIPQKERKLWRWVVAFTVVALLLASAWYAYSWYTKGTPLPIPIPIARADPTVEENDVSESQLEAHAVADKEPRYITLPSLDITTKARVFSVGVNQQNMIAMPRNIHDAGWYKKSMTPGTGYGAVLIDAHSTGIGKDGVFAQLSTLKPGDEITVERGDGKEFTYTVVENRIVDLHEANQTGMKTMMESATPGKEGLNLMTNAGTWIPRLQIFDKRVMLRAVIND